MFSSFKFFQYWNIHTKTEIYEKKIWKHAMLVAVLVVGTTLTFKKGVSAPLVLGVIEQTTCCEGAYFRGYSNDCKSGEGNCIDHFCNPGETELTGSQICL